MTEPTFVRTQSLLTLEKHKQANIKCHNSEMLKTEFATKLWNK